MTKYLGKDERNALIAEFDLGLPCSNPYFYVMKNKKGIYNVKRVRTTSQKKEEEIEEVFDDDVQAALDLLKLKLPDRIRIKKQGPPVEDVILTEEQKAKIKQIEQETGVKIKVPKSKPVKETPVIIAEPLKKDVIVPAKEEVIEVKVEKPKAL
jgi:hypothetical protein